MKPQEEKVMLVFDSESKTWNLYKNEDYRIISEKEYKALIKLARKKYAKN